MRIVAKRQLILSAIWSGFAQRVVIDVWAAIRGRRWPWPHVAGPGRGVQAGLYWPLGESARAVCPRKTHQRRPLSQRVAFALRYRLRATLLMRASRRQGISGPWAILRHRAQPCLDLMGRQPGAASSVSRPIHFRHNVSCPFTAIATKPKRAFGYDASPIMPA
jgi:hypothetical protein